jgi:serine/threonine-protein kinase
VHYTPLEQYGGDTGNTDARSDVYSFGATLYHLLTNEPPAEAKHRFLRPESLKDPRLLNPALSPRVERAILWAMEVHPDDRPADVTTFREALRTTGPLPIISEDGEMLVVQPTIHLPTLSAPVDRYLLGAAGVLFLLAAVFTFLFPLRLP